jgi:hypothetical protein
MKRQLILMAICFALNGCVYTYVCGDGNTPVEDKTITTDPSLQGNVPIQGGTVTNPQQVQGK